MTGLARSVETQPAQVLAVYNARIGAVLAAALAPGNTTVAVDDADVFVDGGGYLSLESADDLFVPADAVAGTDAYYDRPGSQGVAYLAVDRATNVITLAAPWDATFPSFAVGDSVWIDPPAIDRRADVALDGDDSQRVAARVPFSLAAQLPEGVREARTGEWCRVSISEEGFELIDVVNEQAIIDSSAVEVSETEEADAAFDTITVDEVISPSVPRRSSADVILYVDPVKGDDGNAGDAVYPVLDTFERSVVSGWGTADIGGAWGQAVYQGPNQPDVGQSVVGAARLRHNAGNQRNVMVTNDFAVLDGEVLATISHSTSTPGAGAALAGVGRIGDSANLYAAMLQLTSAGALSLTLDRQLGAATWTTLATVALASGYVLGTQWKVRAQIQANPDGGTDIRAKAWLASGAEPEAWMLSVNDTSGGIIASPSRWGAVHRTGSSFGGTTSHAQWHDFTVVAIDESGVPVDVEAGGVGPLATLNAALDHLGSWNDGDVRIVLVGDVEEDLEIDGLGGGGRVIIDGGGVGVLYGRVRLYGVHQYMELRDFTLQHVADQGFAGVDMRTSRHVECINLQMQGNGVSQNGVYAAEGSEGRIENCQMNGYTINAVQCVEGSMLACVNNKGAGGSTSSYRASAGIVFVDGTKPTVATATALGGQVFGTTSSNNAGVAPPTTNRKTSTHTANATKTWRPAWGWKSGDDAYQGEWQGSGGLSRGVAAYGTNLRKPGRTARSAKIYVRRLGSGGPGGKQAVYLAVHPEEKVGGGTPGISAGPTKIGELANGEGKWMDVPKSYAQSVMTGGGRGFMLYHGSPSPYIICAGRSGSSLNFQVKITHE